MFKTHFKIITLILLFNLLINSSCEPDDSINDQQTESTDGNGGATSDPTPENETEESEPNGVIYSILEGDKCLISISKNK